VVDRVVQQAIAQVRTPIYEEQFSNNSFGFRPRRSAHDAIRQCQAYVDEGYKYVVDTDLEKYFDTVNHSKLIEVLSRTIKDGRFISLIHKCLRAEVIVKHKFEETEIGVFQGGPLSPILSNIMLNELDKEIERRGHRRYIMGWVNYFKIADTKSLLKETDEWIRRRISMVYWKQWKRTKTKFQMLQTYGMPEEEA